jgi:hypothetical protein
MARQLNEGIGERLVKAIFKAVAAGEEYSWMRRQQDPDFKKLVADLEKTKKAMQHYFAEVERHSKDGTDK